MKRLLFAAVATLAFAAPASADIVDWNFGDHTGLLGTTQSFTSSGIGLVLLARGFDGVVGNESPVRLFGKADAGDERGLGLNNDPANQDEITGISFVQLNLDGIRGQLSGFQFSMNSTTNGETWAVYGSEDATPFTFTLLASGNDEGVLHGLVGGYDNYNFVSTGGNVLIKSFDAVAAVPGPIVGAGLPGILAAFGMGGWAWRRRKAIG